MGLPPIPVDPTNPGDPGMPPFGDPALPPDSDPPADYPGDVPLPIPEDNPAPDSDIDDGDYNGEDTLTEVDWDDSPLPGDIARDIVDPDVMVPDGTGTDPDNINPM